MSGTSTRRDCLLIFTVGLLFRLFLVWLYPVPYGNDCIGRIYFKDAFFFAHWLPLTQVLVYLPAQAGGGLTLIRLTFALVGALSACGFYLFLKDMVSRRVAVFGALVFSLNSLYIVLSLMPYQDVLFLGLFYSALAMLFRKTPLLQSPFGIFLYGLACLTRYEAWFILPVLVWWRAKLEKSTNSLTPRILSVFRATLVFGWAPILWIALSWAQFGEWNRVFLQTSDQVFYAWRPHFDLEWLATYGQRMGYWLIRFGSPIIVFSLFGLIAIVRNWDVVWSKMKLLFAFGGLVLIFFFFIIGKEFETVNRFVMIPLSIVLVLTILGLEQVKTWVAGKNWSWATQSRYRWTMIGVVLGFLMVYSMITMKRLNDRPEFKVPFELSNYLDAMLTTNEKAVVVAGRFRELTDEAPMAYQRIIAQSKLGRERILCAGLLGEESHSQLWDYARKNQVRYVAIFEDFEPWLPADKFFAEVTQSAGRVIRVFKTKQASIYKVSSWIR